MWYVRGMNYAIQVVVILAVGFASIWVGWTDNGYAIAAVAIFCAWLVTMLVNEGPLGLWRWLHRSPLEESARSGAVPNDGRVSAKDGVRDILPKQ